MTASEFRVDDCIVNARGNWQRPPHRSRYAAREGERRGFVNFQREPAGGRPRRGRPGGVYISAGAIVAIAIIVLLIILII